MAGKLRHQADVIGYDVRRHTGSCACAVQQQVENGEAQRPVAYMAVRQPVACAATPETVALDLGGLVNAIHVASTGVLGLRSIITRNSGPRGLVQLDTTACYKVDYFGAWPSITLDPGAQVEDLIKAPLSCGSDKGRRSDCDWQ